MCQLKDSLMKCIIETQYILSTSFSQRITHSWCVHIDFRENRFNFTQLFSKWRKEKGWWVERKGKEEWWVNCVRSCE